MSERKETPHRWLDAASLVLLLFGVTLLGLSYSPDSSDLDDNGWTRADSAELGRVRGEIDHLYRKLAVAKMRGVEVPEKPIAAVKLLEQEEVLRLRLREAAEAPQRRSAIYRLVGGVFSLLGIGVAMWRRFRHRATAKTVRESA